MAKADLHIHSTASDGLFSPRKVVTEAKKMGFSVIALTDHDTTQGLAEAIATGRDYSVQVVPGIELSTVSDGEEIHILGYKFRRENRDLQAMLSKLKEARTQRVKEISLRLQQLGYDISWPDIVAESKAGHSIGRPHVARAMVRRGYADSVSAAFDAWLNPGRPAFVPRYKLTPQQAIEYIHAAGGLAFLAHPGLLCDGIATARKLIAQGIDGIEVFHSEHSQPQIEGFFSLAQGKGVYISGGSDCHGSPQVKIGQQSVDLALANLWLKD